MSISERNEKTFSCVSGQLGSVFITYRVCSEREKGTEGPRRLSTLPRAFFMTAWEQHSRDTFCECGSFVECMESNENTYSKAYVQFKKI